MSLAKRTNPAVPRQPPSSQNRTNQSGAGASACQPDFRTCGQARPRTVLFSVGAGLRSALHFDLGYSSGGRRNQPPGRLLRQRDAELVKQQGEVRVRLRIARRSCIALSFTWIVSTTPVGAGRPSANRLGVVERCRRSSNTSSVLRHAACWQSSISPRYSTRRCTTLPDCNRRLSSTL